MKLSSDVKTKIVRFVVSETFKTRTENLDKRKEDFAEMAYSKLYPEEIVSKMNKLPNNFFLEKSAISVFNNGYFEFKFIMKQPRKVSFEDACNNRRPRFEAGADTIFSKIKKDILRLEDDIRVLADKLFNFLFSINTDKQLREQWPEGKKFYEQFLTKAPSKNLPSVQVTEINDLISANSK